MTGLGNTKRAAATYIVFAGLQRFVSLLILPFITHALSPDEYGAATMLSSTSLLLTAIVATPLIQLIIRAAVRGEDNGPAVLKLAGIYCYLLLPLTVAVAAVVVALSVSDFLGVAGYLWGIELLAIGFQPAASTFALSVAQAHEDLPRFLWLASTSVLVTVASKLVLIVLFQFGVLGWVISDLLSAVLSGLLAMALVRLPRAQLNSNHVRYVVRFSVPLIPHTASLWAISSMSRPAMAAVSTLEQVGYLSFGLSLAQVAGLIIAEVNRAALSRYARERFRAPTHHTLGPVGWQLIIAFVVPAVIGSGVAVAGPLLFSAAYWPSFQLTGILLISQAAYGLYVIPMNYLTQTGGVTRYSVLVSGTGAALILVSILAFGRRYGAVGLAYATVAGYVTMAVVATILLLVHKFDIEWKAWLANWPEVCLAMVALVCAVAALASPVHGAASVMYAIGSLLLSLGAIALRRRVRSPS